MAQKLLLADDSVTIQRVIELTFADENIQVIAVGDGQQAIARIDSEHPDVVLADIGMPERDGYEVAAHVKGNPATAHIPVLLLTGAFEPIDEARARAVGCDGVLVKPFEPQMVINRVKDLLAGRRPASLWSTPPGPAVTPQGGATSAVSATPMGAPSKPEAPGTPRPEPAAAPPESKSGESLDDYFDRLDAAFSTEGQPASGAQFDAPIAAAPAPPSPDTREEFGAWDIQTEPAGAAAPAPNAAAFSEPAPPRSAPAFEPSTPPANELPTIAPELSPVAQAPALADAFAALLAAEQKVGPSASGTGAPLDEQAIEDIVRRVLARMSDDVVRSTVLELAERLVRDEIDRIKRQANL